MSAIRKFDFGFDFEDESGTSGGGNSQKRNAKIEEAYAKGREAGLEEAKASIDQQITATLGAIAQQLAALESTRGAIEDTMSENAMALTTAIISKVLPSLARREAMNEVQSLISECLGRIKDEPRIVVRVHDSLLDALRDRIDDLVKAAAYEGQVVLLGDNSVGTSGCRVEWADGGAERDLDAIWAEIETTIQRTLSASGSAMQQPDDGPAAGQSDGADET